MSRIKRTCPSCGKYSYTKGDFCQYCAATMSPIDSEIISEKSNQNEGGSEMSTVKKVLIGIVAVILLAVVYWFGVLNGNDKSAADNNTATQTATETTTIKVDGETIETKISTATATDGGYTLHNPDQKEINVDLTKAIGFTPDKNLLVSGLKTETLGLDPAVKTSDFNTYLNTSINGFGPLAGYTDGTNDYNQYYNHQSGPQLPAYSWMIHTGEYIEMPGIGRVEGGSGRAALVLIINRTDRVYRFPTNSVTVVAGFQGWGRIWNGDEKPVIETEKRLTNHYLTRLGLGVPEKGFIGQTDQGAENATTVTVVTVERIQWGNNSDGTPRYQFQLLRAETVNAIKK